jgi:murein DD-endopeptidase MepM/ murein hydrolase activator NlpD
MFDFVKRTNQLMFGAAKESLTDYTRDISELGNAASQVRDKLSSGTKTARDTMVSFKSKGVVSSVSNWFYGKEYELNDADEMLFDNAEFRSGNPEWDNDTEEADTSALTTSSMKELVKGQVSSMYKIGSKQTEAGIANTAEIVTNISKSSAEIVAAVNNVNSSLIAISGKLDGLVELLKPAQKSQSTATNSWTDSDGRFTIRSLMEGFKNPNNYSGSAGMVGTVASMLSDPNMRQMFLTPENLVSMFIMDPLMRKDFKALGGRSVDSYGRQFRDFTHNMIEDAIQTLIERTPLGDVMGREKYRGNLGKTENQYTKEAAVFDKATRHSIISVIPEYLKKLTEAVTGQKWNIDERGYLTTKTQANPYSQIGNTLHTASLRYDEMDNLEKINRNSGSNIDPEDMDNAQNAWISVVVQHVIYNENRNHITYKTIMDMATSPRLELYLDEAVAWFNVHSGGESKKNSRKILRDVLLMICGNKAAANALAQAGNRYMLEIENKAKEISNNNPFADQYVNQSTLNFDVTLENMRRNMGNVAADMNRRRYEESLRRNQNNSGNGLRKALNESDIKRKMEEYDRTHPSSNKEEEVTSRIGMGNSKAGFGSFVNELNKYSKSIYDILNKGVINVRLVTGNLEPNRTQRGKRVHKLRVKKSSSGGSSDDSSDGEPDVEPTEEVASGSSTTGWIDNTVDEIRTNGFVNTIRGKLSEASNAVGTYYTNTKNTLKMESISNKVNAENSTVSDMDKQRVQMVNTALQTAMQDGDGVEDRSKIRMMIANIQDPNLKQEMTKVADSVLTKESSKDEEPKSNSLFGRLLTGLGSKIKSAFSFVLKPIGFLLKGIGKGLKAYWNWTKSVWASGVEDGKRGINTIKGGISDYRDAAAQSKARRQEAKQRVDARSLPVAEMEDISSVKKTGTDLGGKSESTTLAKIKKKLSTGVGYINDGLKWVRDKIKSATNTLVSGIKSIGEKIANSKFGQWASNAASTAVEKTKEVASKIVNSKAGRAVKGFGSDFAAGFSEARSEKKLAKLDKATPDTIADKESRTIREKLEEFMSKFFNGDNKFAKELRELIQKDTKAIEDLSPKMDDIADANEKGNDNLTNKSKGQHAEMDDLYAGKSGPKMESVDTKAKSGDLGKAKSSGGSSAKMADIKDGQNSKGKALGKIAAGGMDVASMIMKFIGPVIAGMAGIQAITELIQGALKDILKPLGKLFTKLFKVLQPVIEILKDALEPFIETVSNVLIDIVTPLAPVIQSIFECISPILDIVTVLLDAIMIPLMAIFDTIIVPSLELVTGCLKAIMGILQMGFGVLMTPLGAILAAIGKLPFPGLSSVGDKGKDLLTKGADMVTSGASMTVEGVKEAGLAALKLTGPGMIVNALMGDDSTAEEEEKTPESYQAKNADVTPGSAMDGLIGNGDIVNNYYYQNMYGSGNSTYNQNSYHNGMNMSQHGCGPIALADRANRMGGGINPYSLTQAMMANGNYSANAGTSVAGMISTGRALGMNLVPGGVTTDSLRGASPRNPITVIGSGMGFGTRSGANHYVNVVGTDSSGGAYVSNPMTGRVGRVRANELVANSALGLYGSGDNDVSYEEVFGENVASAFGELSNIWSNISNIFNFKENETAAEKAQKGLDKEKNKRHIDNVKSKYSEDEWKAKYDEIAKENPKEDKESDEDYEYRINLEVSKALGQELSDKDSFKSFGEKTDEFGNSMNQFGSDFASSLAASNMFGESGGFYSASGNVKLATDGYTPEYTDTNMEESVNGHYIHSPIHEFFAKMGGLSWAESNNNWYKHYSDPHSKEGEGNSGDSHQGIDINLGGGVRGVTPVYATTDGILVIHQPEALAGGGGNYVEWTDNDGIHHRIMHLDHFSEEMENMRPGDPIIGGKTLLGYYGTTGQSTGDHIHYDISPNGYGSSEWYNPLTYFNFKPAATDGDSSYIAGDTLDEQMWQWLRFKGMKLPESSVAGIMGVWKAEGVQPRMIEGAYSEPETSLAEPIYDAIVGDPDNNTAGLQKLWDYTPEHAVGKNGGYLPNYMYNGHQWAGIGLAQWTAGRTYKLLKHAWDHGQRKWYELLPQLQYFEEELKTTHSKAGNELAGGEGHSPEEMAQMFWRDFEGFTWGSQADYDKRRNNARNVYDRFKGTSEINSTNFGTINSNADAYYAGYTDRNPGGGSSSSSSGGGKVWVGNMSFDSPEAANAYKNDKTRIYKDFYNNTLKKAYDKQSLDKRNYGGYPELLLKDYMRAILTPWSAYLDPDRNGVNGLYISHMDADKIFHLANGNNGSGIYSDIKKNGLYDLNEEKFKSAVYSSLISNNRSFAGIKSMLDNIDGMSGLPATQGGYATGTQPLKDHENMLYDYVLDKTIGRATPGFVRNNEFTVSGNLVDLKKSFNNLSYSSPVPIAFQSYVDIHGKDPTVKEFNKYYNGAPDGAMYRIPAIFKTSNKDYISAIRNAYGSGDEIANSIVDIPPIDYSKLPTDDWTDTIWNSMTNQQQQQTQYTQSQNTEVNDQIDRILANEYKTSDKRTHELLEKIYAYLEKKENEDGKPNPNSPDGTTPQGSQDMFEDKIPNSVYRLARG